MKRHSDEFENRVYQYGGFDPKNPPEMLEKTFYLRHRMWNDLVVAHQELDQEYFAIMAKDPETAAANAEVERLIEYRRKLTEEIKAANKIARKRVAKIDPQEKKRLSEEIKAASERAKEARKAAATAKKDELDALSKRRYTATTAIRQEYARLGLWWGNYNAVIDAFNAGKARVIKEGTSLRPRFWTGEGQITVQIQGGYTLEKLHKPGGPIWISKREPPKRGETGSKSSTRGYLTLHMRISSNEYASIPFVMHRQLPEGAIVKMVTANRWPIADMLKGRSFHWKIQFVLAQPKAETVHQSGHRAGLNLGWKQLPGGLRIATLVSSNGSIKQFMLPETHIRRLEHVAALKSTIDDEGNVMLAKVHEHEVPEAIEDIWPRHRNHLPRLTRSLAKGWNPQLEKELATWYRRHKRLMAEHDHLRRKALDHRRDLYRNWASEIARDHCRVTIEENDLRDAARVKHEDGSDPALPAKARSNRNVACIHEFRSALANALAKTGGQLEKYGGPVTKTHHVCGRVMDVRPKELFARCEHCKKTIDKDINAAKNLLHGLPDSREVAA